MKSANAGALHRDKYTTRITATAKTADCDTGPHATNAIPRSSWQGVPTNGFKFATQSKNQDKPGKRAK